MIVVWLWFLFLPFALGMWFLLFDAKYSWLSVGSLAYLILSGYMASRSKRQGCNLYLPFLLIPLGIVLSICFFFALLMFHLPS